MPGTSLAAIIASLHGRSGKTLLARLIAESYLMSGGSPLLFDTDAVDRPLRACFPRHTTVVDVSQVRGQMELFDTLAAPSDEARIVDLTHGSFGKFFDVMRETDFIAEARQHRVEPAIFYIPDRSPDSLEHGLMLRERFADCDFVVVGNGFLGRPSEWTRRGPAYRALATHDLHFQMPALDPRLCYLIDDPTLSLGDFARQPLALNAGLRGPSDEMPTETRAAIRSWLVAIFKEIYRIAHVLDRRASFVA